MLGYAYFQTMTIPAHDEALTAMQVKVVLSNANFNFAHAESDGKDVKFTAADGVTELYHWKEEYDSVNETATIWVLIPSISDLEATVFQMWFGNASAVDSSDIDSVMEFGDEFDNLEKWGTYGSGGTANIIDGVLELATTATASFFGVVSNYTMYLPIIISGKMKNDSLTNNTYSELDLTHDSSFNNLCGISTKSSGLSTHKRTDGAWEDWNSVSKTYLTAWKTFDLKITQNSLQYYENGAKINTIDTQNRYTTEQLQIIMGVYTSTSDDGFNSLDYIFIRKYAVTEPTVSIGSETVATSQILEGMAINYAVVVNNDEFTGTGSETVLNLNNSPIIPNVNVFFDEVLQSADNYVVDYENGIITLNSALGSAVVANVVYLTESIAPLDTATVNVLDIAGTVADTTTTDENGLFNDELSGAGTIYLAGATANLDGGREFEFNNTIEEVSTVDIINNENTAVILKKASATVSLFKRYPLILTENATNANAYVNIPSTLAEFWNNRGVELRVTDENGQLCSFEVYSETSDAMAILISGITGSTGDKYYLYFNDGAERDTSDLDITLQIPTYDTQLLITRDDIDNSRSTLDLIIPNIDGFITDSSLLTIIDAVTNSVCDFVVLDEVTYNGAILALKVQIRAPYIYSSRTFYVYAKNTDDDLMTEQTTFIYPATCNAYLQTANTGEIKLDGYAFAVKDNGDSFNRSVGSYKTENGKTKNIAYDNTDLSYNLTLFLENDEEKELLITLRNKKTILVDYKGNLFTGTIKSCNITSYDNYGYYTATITLLEAE